MTETVSVEGMSCEHCEERVEEALGAVDGVEEATADHEAGSVVVEGDVDTTRIAEAVAEAGYEPSG